MGYSPVSPFVVARASKDTVPGTTRQARERAPDCLAGRSPRPSRGSRHDPSGSYSGHTPSLRHLKHPADQGQAPGTTPAPADLPRLADDLHPSVHVASGCYPAGLCTVCLGFPTSIVSARLEPCDFSGSKLEAPGYPSVRGLHGSAPSPLGFTGKPSPGLSWLSYSRRSVSLRPRPQFGRLRPSRS